MVRRRIRNESVGRDGKIDQPARSGFGEANFPQPGNARIAIGDFTAQSFTKFQVHSAAQAAFKRIAAFANEQCQPRIVRQMLGQADFKARTA